MKTILLRELAKFAIMDWLFIVDPKETYVTQYAELPFIYRQRLWKESLMMKKLISGQQESLSTISFRVVHPSNQSITAKLSKILKKQK